MKNLKGYLTFQSDYQAPNWEVWSHY